MDEIKLTGISTLALWAIPLVLALGAIYWLVFIRGAHGFSRELSQERRHNEIVGAKVLPKSAIEIKIKNRADNPIQITRAEIDGGELWVWYQNDGQSRKEFIQIRWGLVSPDGTVIKQGYRYAGSVYGAEELDPGEKGEAHVEIKSDPRADRLQVEVGGF